MRIVTEIHHLKKGDLIAVIETGRHAHTRTLSAGSTLKEVFQDDIEANSAIVLERFGVDDDGEWADKDGWEEGSGVEQPYWLGPPALVVQFLKPRHGITSTHIFPHETLPAFYLDWSSPSLPASILLISSANDQDA